MMRGITITSGPYKGMVLAPTFENIDLGERKDSFAGLSALGKIAKKAAKNTPYASNVASLVTQTTTLTNDGHSMHLPDVGKYWKNFVQINSGTPIPSPYPYKDAPKFLSGEEAAKVVRPSYLPLHACMGLNSCAGSDRYGVKGPNGNGPNACAGQGYCSTTADHTCHVTNNCANQGGCGLYGTGEEMNNPGNNECRSQGSCATPINAERFSTNGPNRGKSVWIRAREVFETEVWPTAREKLAIKAKDAGAEIPEELGPVPALFEGTGPTYLWISDDNKKRGAMTSCGASGLSGAGGCG